MIDTYCMDGLREFCFRTGRSQNHESTTVPSQMGPGVSRRVDPLICGDLDDSVAARISNCAQLHDGLDRARPSQGNEPYMSFSSCGILVIGDAQAK